MKQPFIVLFCLLLFTGLTFTKSTNSYIQEIDSKCIYIQKNITSYDTYQIDIWDESTEGGYSTSYSEKKNIKLIHVVLFGEMGKQTIDYFFDDGQLNFAHSTDYRYNRPIYWDKKSAEESGDQEIFDENKTSLEANRYYFNNDKLLLWLDNDSKEAELKSAEDSSEVERLITHAYKTKMKFEYIEPNYITEKVYEIIFALPEVIERASYIEKQTKNSRHLKAWIYQTPNDNDEKCFWVKVGEDNGTNFVAHFNFFVNPDNYEIKYYDTIKDTLLSIEQWRKLMKNGK